MHHIVRPLPTQFRPTVHRPLSCIKTFRRTGVDDLFDLQQDAGWEDLEVPQRFCVEVGRPRADHPSVMDQLALERRKVGRGRRDPSIQAVGPVRGIQGVETCPA
jgi:hypothetical protein